MRSVFRKLGWLVRQKRKESEMQDEIRFHLEEDAEEREARGTDSEAARLAARRELGNSALIQEDTRAEWSWIFLDRAAQDLRYALRAMLRNKSFSALAILSLALGIGANTAIFSFMDSILLRTLPVPDAKSLVTLAWHTPRREMHGTNRHDDSFNDPDGGWVGGFFSYPAFQLFRKNDSVFSNVFGYQGAGTFNLTVEGRAELAGTEYVSGGYFGGLRVPPAAGRLIAPDDDRAGAPAVAAISYELSLRLFGRPERAAGQSIDINNIPFTIIGVVPPEFFGADPDRPPDVYVPMHANLLLEAGDRNTPTAQAYLDPFYDWIIVMARLRPGVSLEPGAAGTEPALRRTGAN
jgi:macrolide transport system ATP-binding/permease protein